MSLTSRFCRVSVLRQSACSLPVLIVMCIGGCESSPLSGKALYPVKGKVLLSDGKPLTAGQVVFVAAKSTVTNSAKIESDGTFSLGGAAGGLPEGDYKIRIESGSSVMTKGNRGALPQGKLPFDSIFLDEDVSKLTATVTSDETKNNFEFKLVPSNSSAQSKQNAAESRGR